MTRRAVALLLVAALGLSGCASYSTSEKAFLWASAADLVSTYAAMDRGAHEANPVMTLAGDDKATVIVTSALLTLGISALIHRRARKNPLEADFMAKTLATLRGTAAAINTQNAAGGSN